MNVLALIDRWTHRFLSAFQEVVGSPRFFTGFFIVTLAWMALQYLLPHPVDSPRDNFPLTVLIYTLVGLWIENAMKVQQREQSRLQEEQLRIQTAQLERLERMGKEEERRDLLLHEMVTTLDATVDRLLDVELRHFEHVKRTTPEPQT